MKENVLIEKSIDFGARFVKLHRYLVKTKHEGVLSKQILRSGTSIGTNINEAQYGNSKADFIAKLHIALKETAVRKLVPTKKDALASFFVGRNDVFRAAERNVLHFVRDDCLRQVMCLRAYSEHIASLCASAQSIPWTPAHTSLRPLPQHQRKL